MADLTEAGITMTLYKHLLDQACRVYVQSIGNASKLNEDSRDIFWRDRVYIWFGHKMRPTRALLPYAQYHEVTSLFGLGVHH